MAELKVEAVGNMLSFARSGLDKKYFSNFAFPLFLGPQFLQDVFYSFGLTKLGSIL
jgi:hypothetical protein